MKCHLCTRYTPEGGCDHYEPAAVVGVASAMEQRAKAKFNGEVSGLFLTIKNDLLGLLKALGNHPAAGGKITLGYSGQPEAVWDAALKMIRKEFDTSNHIVNVAGVDVYLIWE